jgi:hypothetical protein
MIRASGSVVVERPAEECFDFVADLRNEPSFNPDASNIRQTSPGPIGLGTKWEEDVRPLGHFVVTVDRYDRPRELGFDARNPRADIGVLFRFAPDGQRTSITAEIEMRPRGPLKLLTPILRPMMQRMYERRRAPMLKRALEGSGPKGV